MSVVYADRVMETSTTTGTGAYTLAGAVTGYQAFSVIGTGSTCYYCAMDVDVNGNPDGGWEVGLGTYTLSSTTLARTTVLASSNSGAAVNWAAGTRRVMLVVPASAAGQMELLTADPASPLDDTVWAVRSGTSPNQTVAVKARIAGVTVTIAEITR